MFGELQLKTWVDFVPFSEGSNEKIYPKPGCHSPAEE